MPLVVYSSSKYPLKAPVSVTSTWEDDQVLKPFKFSNYESLNDHSVYRPKTAKEIQEKLQFFHVRSRPREVVEDAETRIPSSMRSVVSYLEFYTKDPGNGQAQEVINIKKDNPKVDLKRDFKINEESPLVPMNPGIRDLNDIFFNPDTKDLPDLDLLPEELDLPNIIHGVEGEKVKAPSELPSVPTPPPPPPLPHPLALEEVLEDVMDDEVDAGLDLTPNSPSKSTSLSQDRQNLMAAIRDAGGALRAGLRPVQSRAALPKQQHKKQLSSNSKPSSLHSDLMQDLAARLSMRRKGIAGKIGQDDDQAMAKISSMIPPPPPHPPPLPSATGTTSSGQRPVTSSNNSQPDDSDDWDD